ncbi:hypothetical protein D3C85_898230 [compost metagenome]
MTCRSIIPSRSPVHGFIAFSVERVSCSRGGASGGTIASDAAWIELAKRANASAATALMISAERAQE